LDATKTNSTTHLPAQKKIIKMKPYKYLLKEFKPRLIVLKIYFRPINAIQPTKSLNLFTFVAAISTEAIKAIITANSGQSCMTY